MASKNSQKLHPDYTSELARLSKVMGQLVGIEKMIHARRYCPEVIQQIRAARSALLALEVAIIKGHLTSCIKDSAQNDSSAELDRKLKELFHLIKG